jgi:hypothetical protein
MIKVVKNKLFEDPDQSYAKDGYPLDWSVDLAHPFGVGSNGKVKVGPPHTSHETVEQQSAFAFNNYEGRIWPNAGVIAFWDAPTKGYLMNILQELIVQDEMLEYKLTMEDFEDFLFDIPNPDIAATDDAIYTLKEYPENPAINFKGTDSKIKRPQHTISPMNKKQQKVKVSDNIGKKIDDKNIWRRNEPFESAVRPSLTESPDTMCANPRPTVGAWGEYYDSWHCAIGDDKVASYDDADARAFGIIDKVEHYGQKLNKGSFWMSTPGETHVISGRHDYKFAGRIWLQKGIISFWEYPNPRDMGNFMDMMAEYMGKRGTTKGDFEEGGKRSKISGKKIRIMLDDFLVEIIEKDDKTGAGDKYYDDSEKAVWKTKEGQWDTWGADPHIRFSTKYIKVKNYDNLTSIKQMAPEDMAGEHGKSPMDPTKKKRNVPTGFGSKHPEAEKRAEERRDKPFESAVKPRINESPDAYYDVKLKRDVEWDEEVFRPLTFGWYNEKLLWSDEIIDRSEPLRANGIDPDDWGNKDTRVLTHEEIALEDGHRFVARREFQFPGRLWRRTKVITFWEFPDVEEMSDVLEELGDAIGEKIYGNSEWRVEIKDIATNRTKLVPATNFGGSAKLSAKELAAQHVQSPMLRKPNDSGPGKMHSKTPKPIAWKQAMQSESVEEALNENPNATIDPKEWAKYKNPNATPKKTEYNERGNIPFGYYGPSKIFVKGTQTQTHTHLLVKANKAGLLKMSDDWKERGPNSGRAFPGIKVLSFWNYPKDYNELEKIIKDIEANTKLKILNDPEWRIEVPAGEFKYALDKDTGSWGSWFPRVGQMNMIPIDQYKGGHERSEDDLAQQHSFSPIDSRKKKKLPWKTKKTQGLDKLKMNQAMYAESFYPRLK